MTSVMTVQTGVVDAGTLRTGAAGVGTVWTGTVGVDGRSGRVDRCGERVDKRDEHKRSERSGAIA
ncbi:hypothetical protein [Virgisporangium aurantiacum]|uniref:Uncharacterized protein n=1 Tax=Virgisporangium aurantiacum TaxID=175570 RepID=A0A8J3Z2H6_9ACTN|nr:hypothetical protein [Virgisporangium aurantiacum]GIJ55177.1 hypothetical protein Vau01_026930 [Virgisporangium aurantiacum]